MKTYESLQDLSEAQLIDFSKRKLDRDIESLENLQLCREGWFKDDEKLEEVEYDGYTIKVPSLAQVLDRLSQVFPGPFFFKGDRYIPDLVEEEERVERQSGRYMEKDLPILGDCEVYPGLERISYWDENIYPEDHDSPLTAHPVKLRVSFESYQQMLHTELSRIHETLFLIYHLIDG